jgi:hypothetical protein
MPTRNLKVLKTTAISYASITLVTIVERFRDEEIEKITRLM